MALANHGAVLDVARLQTDARASLDSLDRVEGFRNIALAVQVTAYDDTGSTGRAVEIRLQGEAASTVIEAMRHALEQTLAGAEAVLGEHANSVE